MALGVVNTETAVWFQLWLGQVWSSLVNPTSHTDGVRVNLFMAVPTIYAKLTEHYEQHLNRGRGSRLACEYIKSVCMNRIRYEIKIHEGWRMNTFSRTQQNYVQFYFQWKCLHQGNFWTLVFIRWSHMIHPGVGGRGSSSEGHLCWESRVTEGSFCNAWSKKALHASPTARNSAFLISVQPWCSP